MTTATLHEPAARPTEVPAPRLRLAFLDGLRGLAALCVVIHHIYQIMLLPHDKVLPPAIRWGLGWIFPWGHLAVDVFIVVSGYSLMLPIARSRDGRPNGGLKRFFRRRAQRILPPYYAAIVLTMLLPIVLPAMGRRMGDLWDGALPMFTPGVVLSHLALVHNLNPDWVFKIDGVTWTLATEWQIYFVFVLLLLPVWRRFGNLAAVALGFVLGFLPLLIRDATHWTPDFADAAPWYIGEFALGMAGAAITTATAASGPNRVRRGGVAVLLAIAGTVALFATPAALLRVLRMPEFCFIEVGCGFVTASLLVACGLATSSGREGRVAGTRWLLGLLETRGARALGAFSYSLYLVHFPVIATLQRCVRIPLAGWQASAALASLALPVVLSLSYLFYLAFERPFVARPDAAVIAQGTRLAAREFDAT